MRRIRAAATGAVTLSLVLTAAACGGGSPAGGSGSGGGTRTLTYWASNQGANLEVDKKVLRPELDRFEKQTGIKVKLEVIPWSDLLNRILTATTSGQGPDVLNIGNTWSASLQASGALLPWDAENFEAIGGKDRFVDSALGSTGTTGQDPAAVPLYSMAYALYYNKKMFKDAGIAKPPATWDELIADGRKLSKDGKSAIGVEGGNLANNIHQVFVLGKQHGADFFTPEGKADFTSDGAAAAVRAAAPGTRVGLVTNHSTVAAASTRPEDLAAAARADGHTNRWWLDPVYGRGFPADMRELYRVDLPERPGDARTIAAPLDWHGLNYYFPVTVADDPTGPVPHAREVRLPEVPRTGMDWQIDAGGLEAFLLRLTEEYGVRKLYVTENGSAFPDTVAPGGAVHDPERTRYLEQHLAACARALRKGVPLAGYYAWSLLDNFEWAYGYDKRFGLVHVDFATQRRTVKTSGRWYADIVRAHRALGSV
ncbi:family 1 glycosylhydrolase [Streptomyces sp. NPDC001728]|uniref:family 1 glycosylhydrolase n=1 Tax=Streptomyces sp. NPDC001728 TaxID=3154396 RepID=UPI00331F2556